jgi:hypothetical protein
VHENFNSYFNPIRVRSFVLNGAPALMKLITTFPLPHSDILATDAQFRPRIFKARQNHYDPPAEHSGFGGPQFVRSVTGECSSSNGPA